MISIDRTLDDICGVWQTQCILLKNEASSQGSLNKALGHSEGSVSTP